MNCKPGDLAVVVNSAPTKRNRLGAIVEVVRRCTFAEHPEADWIIRWNGREFCSLDRNLRPIRDPGDDAQDETLLWLPSPSREKEPA